MDRFIKTFFLKEYQNQHTAIFLLITERTTIKESEDATRNQRDYQKKENELSDSYAQFHFIILPLLGGG